MGSKSKQAPQGVPRTPVLLPGYCVTGSVCIPQDHRHALWWSAYLAALLRGTSLAALQTEPPWPVPADALLGRQILHEMLEHRWLFLDWATGAHQVREDLKECFRRDGEKGLAERLSVVTTIAGEWWLDAVTGTFLSRTTAGSFDHDFGPLQPDTIKLAPRLDRLPSEIDLADLLAKLGLSPTERRAAYLEGDLRIEEDKSLVFQVYGHGERLLPDELSALAPGLTCYAPHVLDPRGPKPPTPAVVQRPAGPTQRPEPRLAAPVAAPDPLITLVMDDLVRIPAGSFVMGDDRVASEAPRHRVTLTRAFWLGRHPVTQELWERVIGSLPHLDKWERGPRFPIIHVGYRDIQGFIDKLNGLPGGGGFALPTEAEWEYACRAGSSGDYSFDPRFIDDYAWHKGNSERRLHEVGLKKPNGFGLHDMHGLVYETVRDGQRTYQREPIADPVGPVDGRNALARGGGWTRSHFRGPRREEEHFRCASRQRHERSKRVSFRLLRYPEVGA